MHRFHTLLALACALLLALALGAGCGSGAGLGGGSLPPNGNLHAGGASLDQLLSELNALEAPKGVSAAEFASLKDALRSMLLNSGQTRFAAAAPTGPSNAVGDLLLSYIDDGAGNDQDALVWTYRNTGDYDQNGEVNVADMTELGKNLNKTSASPDWLAKGQFADGDRNGEVNIADITPLGQNLLHQVDSYVVEGADSPAGPWSTLATAGFSSSSLVSGARRFTFGVGATPAMFYRVTPQDAAQALGEPSAPSVSFVPQPTAELTGLPSGPQTVSADGTTAVIQLPNTDPTTIAVGDAVLVTDPTNGSYIIVAATVVQNGDQVTITGTPGTIADLVQQGSIKMGGSATAGALRAGSKAASDIPYSFSESGLTLHSGNGLEIRVNQLDLSFDLDVSQFAEMDADPTTLIDAFDGRTNIWNFDMTIDGQIDPATFNGDFNIDVLTNPDPTFETLLHTEKLQASIPIRTPDGIIQAKSPVDVNIYLGAYATGSLDGRFRFNHSAHYSRLGNAATWHGSTGQWINYSHIFDPQNSSSGDPIGRGTTGGNGGFFAFYVRIATVGDMMNNPAQRVAMQYAHALGTQFTHTSTPNDGFDWNTAKITVAQRNIDFTALGDPRLAVSETELEDFAALDSGFIFQQSPDNISGQVLEDTDGDLLGDSPLSGVLVVLYDNTDPANPQVLDSVVPSSTTYEFLNAPGGWNLKIVASKPGYSFDPVERLITPYNGGINPGNDFVATSTGSADSISGLIQEDTTGDGVGDVGMVCTVKMFDNTNPGNPVLLDTVTSNASGNFAFQNISFRGDLLFLPEATGYSFNPAQRTLNGYSGGVVSGADFIASPVTDFGVSGHVQNGLGLPLANVTIEFRRMPEDTPVWFETTDANGDYNTGPRFTPGITFRLIPSFPGSTFTPPQADLLMDSDKVQDFEAFP